MILAGCATGHCNGSQHFADKAKAANAAAAGEVSANEPHTFVFKSEGSKQCDSKSGIKIEKVAESLNGIHVFSSDTRSDGNMHMTLCGAATGRIHVFEIREAEKSAALSAGFKELSSGKNAK